MNERIGIEQGGDARADGFGPEHEFGRKSPLRRCLATGAVQDKDRMVRFVAGPGSEVVPDIAGTLPGRGMWVTADRAAIERAATKGLFSRAAKASLKSPPDLADRVEAALRRRCLDLLGLARKAGDAVAGAEKVRSWLESGQAAVLVQAADGAADGRNRLRALAGGRPSVELLTSAELAAALGREHVVHAALKDGGLAQRFLVEAARLAGLGRAGSEPGGNGRRGQSTPQDRSEAVGRHDG